MAQMFALIGGMVAHERETGGGPTGFGWASFVTLLAGICSIAYMLGRYLRTFAAVRKKLAEGGTFGAAASSASGEQRTDFDPYDDLSRD